MSKTYRYVGKDLQKKVPLYGNRYNAPKSKVFLNRIKRKAPEQLQLFKK